MSPTPIGENNLEVDLNIGSKDVPIIVHYPGDRVASIRLATAPEIHLGELKLSDDNDVGLAQLNPTDAVLAWVGTACDTGFDVTVRDDLAQLLINPMPRHGCDLGRESRAVVLSFRDAWDASKSSLGISRPKLLND